MPLLELQFFGGIQEKLLLILVLLVIRFYFFLNRCHIHCHFFLSRLIWLF